uniref:Uncharacterized protein n=1 Tax=Panagrolaimus superbus TaxID=310955 RepID=A0A914Z2Z3_9BILA
MFAANILLLFITVKSVTVDSFSIKELSADAYSSQVAVQIGKDVRLKTGTNIRDVDLILTNGFLEVEMDFKNCMGKSHFCYNSTDKMDQLNDICFPGYCAFFVEGVRGYDEYWKESFDRIKSIDDYTLVNRQKSYFSCKSNIVRMQYWKTLYCEKPFYSCASLIDKENKTRIYVNEISPSCSIKIKNAQIYNRSMANSSMLSSTPPPTAEASTDPWYLWLILGIIIVGIICTLIAV